MNGELTLTLVALGSLAGLAACAGAMSTRALGEPQAAVWPGLACLGAQLAIAVWAAGWMAGVAATLSAWMLLGVAFVAALNAWPRPTMTWAARIGWTSLAAAALSTGWR